ncbi:type II toxin-antitoxin system VapC family toxin [Halorientalis pallida]|uniref:type II toxin-antitoxin system VapC family toxin n=1 Tax=Halorientalis pallida TaxID=2479928 RepID=UPI003C6EC952
MSVLVDTGVLYAHHDEGSSRHDSAVAAMNAINRGEYGQPYVSDYIYDEAVTLTRARADDLEPAKRIGRRIRGAGDFTSPFRMLHVTADRFEAAVETFERYDDQPLSFTDAASVALSETEGIDRICSYDDDFDGIVDRFDPSTISS